ncbi:hypothetical protein JOB18_028757 [Solea senegalensis]|uniref:Uncharacterized protein n=1 Tax=Solea senegalensis TaxID=28829 RepID=A0AAV6RU33_SOLSE|nr:hypothetical protein JOB18_028757 [Solea senegalensis]
MPSRGSCWRRREGDIPILPSPQTVQCGRAEKTSSHLSCGDSSVHGRICTSQQATAADVKSAQSSPDSH